MTKTKSKTAAKKKPAKKPRAAKAAGSKTPAKAAAKSATKKATKKPAGKPAKASASVAAKKPGKAVVRAAAAVVQEPVAAVPAQSAASAAAKPAPRPSSRRDAASEWIAAAQRAKDEQPAVVVEAPKRAAPPAPIAAPAAAAPTSADSAEVDAFLRDCDHPRLSEFEQVRKLILDASPSIAEGIKWNAPSFRTEEWFATLHVRDPQKVQVVFHLGAKKRDTSQRLPVGAPEGMVEWLAPDRCMVTIEDVKRRGKALQAFVRSWILHV